MDKANAATHLKAKAVVIYNNEPGAIRMDLTNYYRSQPCVSITQEEGAAVKAAGTAMQTEDGLTYYTGTITVHNEIVANFKDSQYLTMELLQLLGRPRRPEHEAGNHGPWRQHLFPGGTMFEPMLIPTCPVPPWRLPR